jgi:hemerythrin-like metal-binding protein
MICVEWIDRFNLGIHEIDDQHKRLVSIMNKICSALNKGFGDGAVGDALDEMADYAKTHFTLEEKYFDAFHYPKTEEHKAWHREFNAKVQSLQEQLKFGKKSLAIDTISFLGGWFIDHTQTFDRDYVATFKTHGVQ